MSLFSWLFCMSLSLSSVHCFDAFWYYILISLLLVYVFYFDVFSGEQLSFCCSRCWFPLNSCQRVPLKHGTFFQLLFPLGKHFLLIFKEWVCRYNTLGWNFSFLRTLNVLLFIFLASDMSAEHPLI